MEQCNVLHFSTRSKSEKKDKIRKDECEWAWMLWWKLTRETSNSTPSSAASHTKEIVKLKNTKH
jgi:hypothetical protein